MEDKGDEKAPNLGGLPRLGKDSTNDSSLLLNQVSIETQTSSLIIEEEINKLRSRIDSFQEGLIETDKVLQGYRTLQSTVNETFAAALESFHQRQKECEQHVEDKIKRTESLVENRQKDYLEDHNNDWTKTRDDKKYYSKYKHGRY